MYSIVNGRSPRSKTQMYNSIHHPFANYYTEALQKTEMKMDYENEIFLNNLHLIPDPLMKNLADTLVTSEKPEKVKKQSLDTPIMKVKKQSLDTPMMAEPSTMDVRADSTLAGITNFFSGVFNMLSGAVFRTKSPVRYHDCFDEARQGSPQSWRSANDDQDKNGQVPEPSSGKPNGAQDMNNCKTISSCEEKLNQVKCLLTKPSKPSDKTPAWRKRPKRVFVEPGLAEDSFEDAFSPEDLVALSNDQYIEYFSPPQYQNEELIETEAPRTKIEPPPAKESMEIVKVIDCEKNMNEPCDLTEVTQDSDKNTDSGDEKQQLVSSCEDKLSKLKALLQEKRKKPKLVDPSPEQTLEPKPTKTIPISKPVDKHFKNRHRMLDKRRKMKIKRSIQDDVIFANEIDLDSPAESPSTPSTVNSDTSLGEYFDEMKGRFHSTSTTESEDSFQIVFNDSPKHTRKASDCESEDSFIVFEDDCYTSNDVFGDSDSESDESDVSDSGCSTMTCKLSHSLSRTVSNLTDDTLYESSDEVDCAKMEPEARGLLVDATRKSLRKNQPPKKVHFSTEPPTVKVMRVWAFAARQARAGHWERYALDRDRFKRRIADVDMAVSWVLKPQHRSRVMFQRFMPLWNRQRRQELEEKKVREKEEKRLAEERKEEERIEAEREEERRIEEEMEEDRRIEEEVLEEMRQEALMRMKDKIHDIMNRDTQLNVKKIEKTPDKVRRYDRNGQLIDSPPTPEAELNLPKNNVRNCENNKMTNGIKGDEIDERNNNVLKSETQISDSVTDITDKLESSKLVEPINVNEEIGT